uniref:Apple domain-containing protein n=1 Tax=Haemonchus contortus TaxID=6289 RepID=A0A7I4Y7N3_HAECO
RFLDVLNTSEMTFLRQSLISPFATFLILVQVDQMRFCTFEQAPFHSKPYYYYLSFIKYENSSSLGACLKKCVEEMPACVQVAFIRNATDEQCSFYKASEEASYAPDAPGYEFYNLKRGVFYDSCPMAESLYPA